MAVRKEQILANLPKIKSAQAAAAPDAQPDQAAAPDAAPDDQQTDTPDPAEELKKKILSKLPVIKHENVPRGTSLIPEIPAGQPNQPPPPPDQPKSMQPATTGVNPATVHTDMQRANSYWQQYLSDMSNWMHPVASPSANVPVTKGNADQAVLATKNEIKASQNYLASFYNNHPELAGYMSNMGLGSKGQFDPQSGINKVLNTDGDYEALSVFSSQALSLLNDKRKKEQHAIAEDSRGGDPDWWKKSNAIDERYLAEEKNLRNSIAGVANIKVSNQYLQEHGTTTNITPKNAQEIGWRYMEAVGDGVNARKERELSLQGRLTPEETVNAQLVGYRVMQYKMMDAATNGQTSIAQNLSKHVENYGQQIRESNPEYIRNQKITALSEQINKTKYKGSFWGQTIGVHPSEDMVQEAADQLGMSKADIADIKPSDIKAARGGIWGKWASGIIGSTSAPLYEFTWRHVIPFTDKDAVNKRFDENWYDNSDVAKYVGGQQLNSDQLKEGGSVVNTDPHSQEYLLNKNNPNAGKWNADFSNIAGIMANGIGMLTGYSKGINVASNVVGKVGGIAGFGTKVASVVTGGEVVTGIAAGTDLGEAAVTSLGENAIPAASRVARPAANLAAGPVTVAGPSGVGLGLPSVARDKIGTAVYTYLANYDHNKHEADRALPGDGANATWLANLYTAADIIGMEIINPAKLRTRVLGQSVMSGKKFIDKVANEGFQAITKQDIMTTFKNGMKESGKDFLAMQGGMDATTAGHYLSDMMLAPEKYKTEDNADNFIQSNINNALINALPALAGGFGHATAQTKLLRGAMYDVGSNPRGYLHSIDLAIEKGEIEANAGAQQKAIVNTLHNIVVNSVPDRSVTNGNNLTAEQKEMYAANLFNEAIISKKAELATDKVQTTHIDAYIKDLQKQREDILNHAGESTHPADASGFQVTQSAKDREPLKPSQNNPTPTFKVDGDMGTDNIHPWAVSIGNDINVELGGSATFATVARDEAHNNAIAGNSDSYHLQGAALDVKQSDWNNLGIQKQNDLLTRYNAIAVHEGGDNATPVLDRNNTTAVVQGDHIHIQPKNQGVLDNFNKEAIAENTPVFVSTDVEQNDSHISVNELLDKPVIYQGKQAIITRDGNETIVRMTTPTPEGKFREYSLGKTDDVGSHSIKDYGIEQHNSVVKVNEAGGIEIRGNEYVNNHSDPLAAISYDKEGNPVVSLETKDGKKRNFRGSVAEDIAYNLTLKEIEKRNETKQLESFINTNDEARTAIEQAKSEADTEPVAEPKPAEPAAEHTAQPEPGTEPKPAGPTEHVGSEPVAAPAPVANHETVSRPVISRKPVAPDLFTEPTDVVPSQKYVHPDFDFEEEPSHAQPAQQAPVAENKPAASAPEASPAQPVAATQQLPFSEPAPVAHSVSVKGSEEFFNAPRTPEENIESDKVGDNIKNKFAQSEKVVGNSRTRTLHDGSKITGKYVLVDARSVTASNNPFEGFKTSEGFPTLEDGRNPNDRDYTQKETAGKVLQRANNYDGRAVENVPTVDKNGIVIDGNDRTMSGQLAAKGRTDSEYYKVLKENAANFGFTSEQIDNMRKDLRSPRVVFVPDAIMPYTTETFLKFNPKSEGKVKSNIENTITYGRTTPNELIGRLGDIMDSYETTAQFFKSPTAMRDVRALMERYKIINPDNVNEYFDSPTSMNTHGRELMQNLMLGKTFGESELRLLQDHKDIREKLVYSMNNIMGIEALGPEYSLKKYFDEALHMWDTIERYKDANKGIKTMDEALAHYDAQGRLDGSDFSPEARVLFNELNSNKKSSLRELTKTYLSSAKDHAQKGEDIFGNQPASREQLISDYVELKRQYEEQLRLAREAADQQPVGQQPTETQHGLPESDQSPQGPPKEGNEGNGGKPAEIQPGQSADAVAPADNTLFEPTPEYHKPVDESAPPAEPTASERDIAYNKAIEDRNKYNGFIKTKEAAIESISHKLEDLKNDGKKETQEYIDLAKSLQNHEAAIRQYLLKRKQANIEISKFEGTRYSDVIRNLKNKIADDLTMAVPGITPQMFKPIIDFVASSVKLGEHIHDAILNAIIKFKEKNPTVQFDEDQLAHELEKSFDNLRPGRDENYKPQLESAKNKDLADAIIGKIKLGLLDKADAIQKIKDHPSLSPETKDRIAEYVDYHIQNEQKNTSDPNNKHFLDDYNLRTAEQTKEFVSGKTIFDVFGEKPTGPQEYEVMHQAEMLQDGANMIDLAKDHYGQDVLKWGPQLLEAAKEMDRDNTPKKAVLLASMMGKLREEMLRSPEKSAQIQKILDATEAYWQKFIRNSSLELVAAKLLRMYRDKNLGDFYADKIMSDQQRKAKNEINDQLAETKITDKIAEEGVLRDEKTATEEVKALDNAKPEKQVEKPTKEKAKKERSEEYSKKAKEALGTKDLKSMIDNIIEGINKTPC